MEPAIIKLPDIYRGCLYPAITFFWKDKDGNPFDLNGWVPLCFTKDYNLHVELVNLNEGETQIKLTKEITRQFRLGQQAWDFIWVEGATVYPPVLSGTVMVREPLSDTTPPGTEGGGEP